MNGHRDLMNVRNLGEFAFAMCAIGLVLALISFVTAFFALELIGIRGRASLGFLCVAIWICLNVPLYRSLRRRARCWNGERRATKQTAYVELCSAGILLGLTLLAGETTGAHELIMVLKYLFSFWILALLGYQVLLHFVLRYRILVRDAIRWSILVVLTVLNLCAKSSQPIAEPNDGQSLECGLSRQVA